MPPVAAYMPTPEVPWVPEVPEVPRVRVPRFRGSKGSRLAIEPGTVRTLEPEPLELRELRNLWNLTWRRTRINATRSGVPMPTPQVPRVPEVPEVPRVRVPRFGGSKGSRLAIE